MNKAEEIKKRAKELRGNEMSLQAAVEEKEICEELDRISEADYIDEEKDEKILTSYRIIFIVKEKVRK